MLELQKKIIYGPVHSRRLGRSLGINVLPAGRKICSFNCLYCQYGWEESLPKKKLPASLFPSIKEVEAALEEALSALEPPPAFITFSGNGEATLHPDFAGLVQTITRVRDRMAPEARTAILSNSTTVGSRDIRDALERLDVRIMKLDAAFPDLLTTYNRPAADVIMADIINGLASMQGVTIQTLFSRGSMGNFQSRNITPWIDCLKQISPSQVQIYTLDRASPSDTIHRVSKSELLPLQKRLRQEHIRSEVY